MGGWVRRNSNVVRILKSFGNYGRPLTSNSLMQSSLETEEKLKAKHPSQSEELSLLL